MSKLRNRILGKDICGLKFALKFGISFDILWILWLLWTFYGIIKVYMSYFVKELNNSQSNKEISKSVSTDKLSDRNG